ncbi:hypothetical protein PSI15_15405 [Xenorhabdus sp. PR6a]|uniref:hypothetical protein n=1 Tax=Xenorhabdus sp. PR6a TaxID=3025877 RepID=UPI0023599301|nr:hypothetical protein [Xenorhabdus sp. PR6a]MDC9582933.1 hypothetical protein [Xenorhabdus sp. PR6a]
MSFRNKKLPIALITFAVFFLIYFVFFYKWDVKEAIAVYGDANCPMDQGCLVDLYKLTPFSWDRAYIFPVGADKKFIDEAIGMHYQFVDVGVKYIFIKDNHIVYSEEYFPDLDYRDKNQVLPHFAGSDPKDNAPIYYFLTKENSQLIIKKYQSLSRKRNRLYGISPANENQSEKSNPYKK